MRDDVERTIFPCAIDYFIIRLTHKPVMCIDIVDCQIVNITKKSNQLCRIVFGFLVIAYNLYCNGVEIAPYNRTLSCLVMCCAP